MGEGFMIYTIIVTLVSGGLFLIFTKMILNYLRDRKKSPGASLGTSELEALIQRAVEVGAGDPGARDHRHPGFRPPRQRPAAATCRPARRRRRDRRAGASRFVGEGGGWKMIIRCRGEASVSPGRRKRLTTSVGIRLSAHVRRMLRPYHPSSPSCVTRGAQPA